MDDFDFGDIDINVSTKHQEKVTENILYFSVNNNRKKHILVLLELATHGQLLIRPLSNILKEKLPDFDFDIVSATKVKLDKNRIKKETIYRFYEANKSDFKSYIRENTVILCFGISLSSIIESPNLLISCFYDYIFNKTYFFAPQTGTYVVPVDGLEDIITFNEKYHSYIPADSSRYEFFKHQLDVINNNSFLCNPPIPKRKIIHRIKTVEDFDLFYNEYKDNSKYPMICWDTETDGLDFNKNKIGCITCAFSSKEGFYLPIEIVDILKFNDLIKNKTQIAQNGKFDVKFVRVIGITNARIDIDTLQLGNHLNELRFNSLKSLVYHYTLHGGYDKELDAYKYRYGITNYLEIPYEMLSFYATMDSIIGFEIFEEMWNQMLELDMKYLPPKKGFWTLRKRFEELRMPSDRAFTNIEYRGFYVNMPEWDKNSDECQRLIVETKQQLISILKIPSTELISSFEDAFEDDDFLYEEDYDEENQEEKNLNSGAKLGKILEAIGWENLGRTKAGPYKTGDDQLTRWEQLGHPEASTIKILRAYLTLQKTFLGKKGTKEGWRAYIHFHPEDKSYRIHCSYGSMLTESGRNKCNSPNYQQMPSGSLGAELFKKIIYVPDPKKYFLVTLDYASFQMRLSALDVGNVRDVMFKAYVKDSNVDMHSKTSYNVFCVGNQYDVEEIVLKDGDKEIRVFSHEEVKIKRNGELIKVKASEILETDSLI